MLDGSRAVQIDDVRLSLEAGEREAPPDPDARCARGVPRDLRGTRRHRGTAAPGEGVSACRVGARHRPRDPRAAQDAHEDVLQLRGRIRRRAEHAYLPGVPRVPRRATRAERDRRRVDDQARSCAELPDRRARCLPPQELLLSRQSQGLPDLPVRRAALHRRILRRSWPNRSSTTASGTIARSTSAA